MKVQSTAQRFRYSRLVAPIILILFALGWYQFSVVYIQGANNQLVENDNLSVYVPVQQIHGYLVALLDATYIIVTIGLVLLAYNLVKFLQFRTRSPS